MAGLTNDELLLLDNLIYTDFVKDGRTVAEVVAQAEKAIENGTFGKPYGGMDVTEWKTVFAHIKNDKKLCSYVVTNYENNAKTGMRAACFVDNAKNPTDINVAFRGTSSDNEWHDNGAGMYVSDTPEQIASANYINKLPESYGNKLTVTGHSKGGNRAQYVTIATDRVGRCVSYDGQGFSQQFIQKYGDKIEERRRWIKSISAKEDPVNALLQPIAGEITYIETEKQPGLLDNHKPCILLDSYGKLRPVASKPSPWTILINEYTVYLDKTLKEPYKSMAVDGVLGFLEKGGHQDKTVKEQVLYALKDDYGKESPVQGILGLIIAAGHADDFLIDFLVKHYGSKSAIFLAIMSRLNPLYAAEILKTVIKYSIGKSTNRENEILASLNTAGPASDFIYLSTDGLRTEAMKLKKYQAEYTDTTDKLTNLIIALKDDHIWDTTATELFIQSYLELKTAFEKFGTALAEYATIMETVSNRMEETDRRLSSKIDGITL